MKLTKDQYLEHCSLYDGYCAQCDDITVFSGVEPDAEDRECDSCETPSAMGVEQALICGHLEIEEDS